MDPIPKEEREATIAALIEELGCDRASAEALIAMHGDLQEDKTNDT